MTVTTDTPIISAPGNGAATSFPSSPMKVFDSSEFQVFIKLDGETEATEVFEGVGANNYSISTTFPGTRAVTFDVVYPADLATPLTVNDTIYIRRKLPLTQSQGIENQGGYLPHEREKALDRGAMVWQSLQEQLDRAAVLPVGSSVTPATLVANINALRAISADISTVAGVASNVTTVAGIAANVTTVAGDSAEINTLAGLSAELAALNAVSAGITTVAGISTDVSTVAAIAADVTAAANNIPKANRTAVVDPTVNDDVDLDYSEGSLWINTVSNEAFICVDPSDGAAIWQPIEMTGAVSVDTLEVGDPGLEASGININGVTYTTRNRVNDIGGTHAAQFVLHRHSTTLQPLVIGARANDNTSSHTAVVAGQSMFSIFGAGYTGTHYDLFAEMSMEASSSGTISATSSPGKLCFKTTPDGSNTPTDTLCLDEDKGAEFFGYQTVPEIAAPATPGANKVRIYAKADGLVYSKDDAGVETLMSSGVSGGKVLQVVSDTDSGAENSTSTTLADITGLSAVITPSSASSKVLVMATINGLSSTAASTYAHLAIARGGTAIFHATETAVGSSATSTFGESVTLIYLDSPATTSATTYTVQFARTAGSGTITVHNYNGTASNVNSSITAIEIGA